MKSSFILHIDSLCILDKMSDEQAGRLFKIIYQYQKTRELPEMDLLMEVAITPFINQFFRDEKGYEKVLERNRENGKHGGRPAKEPKKPSGLKITQANPNNPEEPKKPDSDSDSVNDNDSVSKRIGLRPDVLEVSNYFMEIGLDDFTAQAQAKLYINHYTSNGWKVGKNSMKDWRAAARGWKERIKTYKNGTHQSVLNGKPENLGTSGERVKALREW